MQAKEINTTTFLSHRVEPSILAVRERRLPKAVEFGCVVVFLLDVVRMYQTEIEQAFAEREIPEGLGLWYDAERLILEGAYLDEITAYRARRRWIGTLETNFLLEGNHDFSLRVESDNSSRRFIVRCTFLSACGRYAFWRLTHHQAPEVQFLLETAHLPCASLFPPRIESFLGDESAELESQLFHSSVYREQKRSTLEKLGGYLRARVRSLMLCLLPD